MQNRLFKIVLTSAALLVAASAMATTPNLLDGNGNPIRDGSNNCFQNLNSIDHSVCLDPDIVLAVKAAFAAKPELKANDLKVTIKDGDVTLAGNVDSGAQLYAIATTAQKVKGVKSVFPDVTVKN